MTDFPYGDGFKDCPKCRGRGCIPVEMPGLITPATKPCPCVEARDRLVNMNKRLRGLAKAKPVKSSPLQGREGDSVRITARLPDLKRHLHRVALDNIPDWNFAVESDRDLAAAWLHNKKASGDEIYDVDVAMSDGVHESLEDLSNAPGLLILVLGVKAARNSASPELVVDVVQGREFLDKPTWVVDSPMIPLAPGHISYSEDVANLFLDWDHFRLSKAPTASTPGYYEIGVREGPEQASAPTSSTADVARLEAQLRARMQGSPTPTKGKRRGRKKS